MKRRNYVRRKTAALLALLLAVTTPGAVAAGEVQTPEMLAAGAIAADEQDVQSYTASDVTGRAQTEAVSQIENNEKDTVQKEAVDDAVEAAGQEQTPEDAGEIAGQEQTPEDAGEIAGQKQILEDAGEAAGQISPGEQEAGQEEGPENAAAGAGASENGSIGTGEIFIEEIETLTGEQFWDRGDSATEELITEALEESGSAECASFPALRLFSAGNYTDSYGNQLKGEAKRVYDRLEQECAALEASYAAGEETALPVIDCVLDQSYSCRLTGEERNDPELRKANGDYADMVALLKYPMQSAYDAYIFDHPEAFWMGAPTIAYSLSYSGDDTDGYVCTITRAQIKIQESYTGFLSLISTYNVSVEEAFSQIQAGLGEEPSRLETVRAVHDYLCDRLSYASEYLNSPSSSLEYKYIHSAAGVFVSGENKVVCDGYAKAFKILLNKFGTDCVVIPGEAREPHAWNYVRMEDGNWYLTDVTWDDSNDIKSSRYFLLGSQTVPSGTSVPVGEARSTYSNFSGARYTMSFAVPELYTARYHTEHSWTVYTSNRDANCTQEGTRTAICEESGCNAADTVEDTGSALGHQWAPYRSNGDATCLGDGTKTAVCSREGCTAQNTVTDTGSALGHQWTPYRSNGDATCLEDGTKTAVCSRVGCTARNTVTDTGSKLAASLSLNVRRIRLKVKQSFSGVTVSDLAPGDSVRGWSSDAPEIASVNARTGKIKAKKKGTAHITVTLQSGKTAQVTVKVQKKTVKTKGISGIQAKLVLKKKARFRLTPVLRPITSRQKLAFYSSDKSIATVSKKGVITAKRPGRTTITVRSGSRSVKCRVRVK